MRAMPKRTLAVAALVLTVTIWGTTFVATKVALREVGPFTLTLLRFALACAVLLPLAWSERRCRQGPLPWRQLALAGLVGGFLHFALQNVGLVYTTASKASLILGSVPALTALLSILVLHESVSALRGVGIVASVVGVVGIVLASEAGAWEGGMLVGDVMVAGAGIAWAAYTVQAKGLESTTGAAVVSAASVGFGALFTLPFGCCEVATQGLPAPTLASWLAIAYLGLVASAAPFLFWNHALSQLDASEAAAYVNLVPVVSVLGAVVLLGETVAPAQLVGGALVLAGVWATGRQRGSAAVEATAGQRPRSKSCRGSALGASELATLPCLGYLRQRRGVLQRREVADFLA